MESKRGDIYDLECQGVASKILNPVQDDVVCVSHHPSKSSWTSIQDPSVCAQCSSFPETPLTSIADKPFSKILNPVQDDGPSVKKHSVRHPEESKDLSACTQRISFPETPLTSIADKPFSKILNPVQDDGPSVKTYSVRHPEEPKDPSVCAQRSSFTASRLTSIAYKPSREILRSAQDDGPSVKTYTVRHPEESKDLSGCTKHSSFSRSLLTNVACKPFSKILNPVQDDVVCINHHPSLSFWTSIQDPSECAQRIQPKPSINSKNKLHAFTIMELLVVMGVSSLIITSAYFILTGFTTFFDQQSHTQESNAELIQLHNKLSNDVFGAISLEKSGSQIIAIHKDHQVIYEKSNGDLIRDFEGLKEVMELQDFKWNWSLLEEGQTNGLIQSFMLNFELDHEQYNWSFQKHYGSSVYMNNGN